MKVLQINAVYGKKSTGKIVEEIHLMLHKEGHESYVAGPFDVKNIDGYKIGNKVDWKIHALITRLTGKQGFYSRRATKKFLKYLDDINPDIIHFHNLHANFINLPEVLHYIKQKNIALVITLHDCWFFTGKCFHFADIACQKYQNGCINCPKKRAEIPNFLCDRASWVYRTKKKLFDEIEKLTVVGCSRWISSLAKEQFFAKKNVKHIYNGIDTKTFKFQDKNEVRKRKNLNYDFVVLGMANKWGLSENEEAVKKLFVKYANSNTCFLIIGCNQEIRNKLQTMALKCNAQVCLVDYVQAPEELAEYYASADVFVNLTHIDTLPTVNMESICCGTPVVTYDSGGSSELILEKCGFVVSCGDVNRLIACIEETKGLDRKYIADTGKEVFNAQINFRQYLNVYSELMRI